MSRRRLVLILCGLRWFGGFSIRRFLERRFLKNNTSRRPPPLAEVAEPVPEGVLLDHKGPKVFEGDRRALVH